MTHSHFKNPTVLKMILVCAILFCAPSELIAAKSKKKKNSKGSDSVARRYESEAKQLRQRASNLRKQIEHGKKLIAGAPKEAAPIKQALVKATAKRDEAIKVRNEASEQVKVAMAELKHVRMGLLAEFDSTPGMAKFNVELQKQSSQVEAVREKHIDGIRTSARYKRAKLDIAEAEKERERLLSYSNPDQARLSRVAVQLLEYESQLRQLEKQGLESDPAYVEANTKLRAAQEEIGKLRSEFVKTIDGQSDMVDAERAIDSAKEKLAEAQKELASVIREYGQAKSKASRAERTYRDAIGKVRQMESDRANLERQAKDKERQASQWRKKKR